MVLREPLDPASATSRIHAIARTGDIAWTRHVEGEMAADGLTSVDCVNVLRAGAVREPADLERGTWRYRVHTNRICVVVAFRSESELVVVTTWRKKR
jgi:hypothetical protein